MWRARRGCISASRAFLHFCSALWKPEGCHVSKRSVVTHITNSPRPSASGCSKVSQPDRSDDGVFAVTEISERKGGKRKLWKWKNRGGENTVMILRGDNGSAVELLWVFKGKCWVSTTPEASGFAWWLWKINWEHKHQKVCQTLKQRERVCVSARVRPKQDLHLSQSGRLSNQF